MTLLIGLFIILIMVMSVMDLWQGSEDTYKYHNIEFTRGDYSWSAYINNVLVGLPYSPAELENVTDVDFSSFNSLEKIYLSTDNPLANYKAMDYFRKRIALNPKVVIACIPEAANFTECGQLPLKGCSDADNYVGVIVFNRSDEFNTSFVSPTCMVVEGNSDTLMRVFDRYMLKTLGV